MRRATPPFFTVGHSNRSLDELVSLLQQAGIERVVDIRRLPVSRAHPQFNEDALAKTLPAAGIDYRHEAALGGLRGKTQGVPVELNALWTNASFHRYADYALSEPFVAGLDRLVAAGRERRAAIMCAEAVWWRCHRRIVADYLLARGESVFHVMGKGRLDPSRLTPGAIVQPDGAIVYPAANDDSP